MCPKGCRFSTVRFSPTMLAKAWGAMPGSLGPAGAGFIGDMEALIRCAGGGVFPLREIWAIAADATEPKEVARGATRGRTYWGVGGDDDEEAEIMGFPGEEIDRGFDEGHGPRLPARLSLQERTKDEIKAARRWWLGRMTAAQVSEIRIPEAMATCDREVERRLREFVNGRRIRRNAEEAERMREVDREGRVIWGSGQVGGYQR